MENLYYLIPFFLILICVMPVFVKIRGSYNVLKNRGAFALYIFGVKVKSYRFMLSHMSIKLYDEEDQKEEDLDFESKEAILMKNLVGQVKEKTKVKLIEVNYNIGVGDAFQTAMLCGVVNALLLTFFTRKPPFKFVFFLFGVIIILRICFLKHKS